MRHRSSGAAQARLRILLEVVDHEILRRQRLPELSHDPDAGSGRNGIEQGISTLDEVAAGFDWFAYIWQVAAGNGLALLIVGVWWWLRRRGRDIDAGLRLAEVES